MSPHHTLGLSPSASPEEIKQAYRRLAAKWHPDRNPDDPTSTAKFAEIQQAYVQLTKRSNSIPSGDFDDIYGAFTSEGDIGSVFNHLFGQIFGNRPQPQSRQPRELNLHAQTTLLFTKFILGGQIELTINQRTVQITLPPNLGFGQTIRIPHGGQQFNGQVGDLYLTLEPVFPQELTAKQRKILERFQASFAPPKAKPKKNSTKR